MNGSTWPAFLWQNFCENHFGHPNRLKIHITGCICVKYQSLASSDMKFLNDLDSQSYVCSNRKVLKLFLAS